MEDELTNQGPKVCPFCNEPRADETAGPTTGTCPRCGAMFTQGGGHYHFEKIVPIKSPHNKPLPSLIPETLKGYKKEEIRVTLLNNALPDAVCTECYKTIEIAELYVQCCTQNKQKKLSLIEGALFHIDCYEKLLKRLKEEK